MKHIFFLLFFLLPLLVWSQPAPTGQVEVRATTSLRIRTEKTPRGVIAVVSLRDDLFIPLEEQEILLSVEGYFSKTAQTNHGEARFALSSLPFATYAVDVVYRGNELYAPSQLRESIDISKITPTLQVESSPQIALDEESTSLLARLLVDDQAIQEALITLEGLQGSPKTMRTDESGTARFSITPSELATEGPNTLLIRYDGDALHNPVSEQRFLVLVLPTTLQLTAPASSASDEEVSLSGELLSARGPLAEKGIAIWAQLNGGEAFPIGEARSEDDGTFSAVIPAERFPSDSLVALSARFLPDETWLRASESDATTLRVLPPRPVPTWLYVLPIAACALVGILVLRFRRVQQKTEIEAQQEERPKASIQLGIERPEAPALFDISGTVCSATNKKILAHASIFLRSKTGEELRYESDKTGSFEARGLSAGVWTIKVACENYLPQKLQLEIPHHGRGNQLVFALLPVREYVLDAFRTVALRVLPEQQLWGRWTPREIRRFARKQQLSGQASLRELAALFEALYFAGVVGTEQDAQTADKLSEELTQVLGKKNLSPEKPS